MSEEQWTTYSQMRTLMAGGVGELKAGARSLAQFLESGDLAQLDAAISRFEQGGLELVRLQDIQL